ncbi:hypothetical protein DM02DRAFT_627444 [Periconia macrospinosa]|uniref:Uncharacterized protein n=1 Tax=Periconia macrospinosa TaxID=97972 RepID=A0A2V1DXT4_9PLEO|nr:hypothetical protein DM02DRAFT_627444 [Periconia macrospinosa]
MSTQNNNITTTIITTTQEQGRPLSPAHLGDIPSPHIQFVMPMASKPHDPLPTPPPTAQFHSYTSSIRSLREHSYIYAANDPAFSCASSTKDDAASTLLPTRPSTPLPPLPPLPLPPTPQEMKPTKSRSPSPYPGKESSPAPPASQPRREPVGKAETQKRGQEQGHRRSWLDPELALQRKRREERMEAAHRRKRKWDLWMMVAAVIVFGGLGIGVAFWIVRKK